jgi:hypothetical protein
MSRFASYAESMLEVEEANVRTKSEADKILQQVEPVRHLSAVSESLTDTLADASNPPISTDKHPKRDRRYPQIPYTSPTTPSCHSPDW